MRVLHLVKTAVGATWAWRQMRELVKLGEEVHVAVPPDGPLISRYKGAGVHTHLVHTDFPVGRPWQVAQVLRELRQLVDKVQPDIIHSHFVGTTLTMRLALGKDHSIPRIFQVPGPLHLEHPLFRMGELVTAGQADFWVGTCQWTSARYRSSGIEAGRVYLSYYGTDLEQMAQPERGKLRSELGIRDDTYLVGMVAYMYKPKRYLGQTRGLKGHEDLIDAIAILRSQGMKIKGVFVGGAWANAAGYEARVRAYGQSRCGEDVVFLGTRDDVPSLYPDFDVAVHPSHSENVGGAAESLLFQVPTIATRVGGFPDVVVPGATGWLVPPKSPHLLAQAIREALSDRGHARKMASEGQQLVRRLFDVTSTAQEIQSIYQQVISLGGGR